MGKPRKLLHPVPGLTETAFLSQCTARRASAISFRCMTSAVGSTEAVRRVRARLSRVALDVAPVLGRGRLACVHVPMKRTTFKLVGDPTNCRQA